MNIDMFNKLSKGAYIINGGRGPQLVEDDLLRAIESGQIAGAALDVFENEPYDGPLKKIEREACGYCTEPLDEHTETN